MERSAQFSLQAKPRLATGISDRCSCRELVSSCIIAEFIDSICENTVLRPRA